MGKRRPKRPTKLGFNRLHGGEALERREVMDASLAFSGDSILYSVDKDSIIGGEAVYEQDIVEMEFDQNGNASHRVFFRGHDHGLTANSEDIDGVSMLPNGDLLISTEGRYSVPGTNGATLRGGGEDVLRFHSGAGRYSKYVVGANLGLGDVEVDGVSTVQGGLLVTAEHSGFVPNVGNVTPSDLLLIRNGRVSKFVTGRDVGLGDGANPRHEEIDAVHAEHRVSGDFPSLYLSLEERGSFPGGTSNTNDILLLDNGLQVSLTDSQSQLASAFGGPEMDALHIIRPSVFNVSDTSVVEGDVGETNYLRFVVTRTPAVNRTEYVQYVTSDDTATVADDDYARKNARWITFEPYETAKTVVVAVNGDNKIEANEDILLRLTKVSRYSEYASLGDDIAVGSIQNDDSDHFGAVRRTYENGYRQYAWYLDGDSGDGRGGYEAQQIMFGSNYQPLTGDFDGDGISEFVLVRQNGRTGGVDWFFDSDGDGKTEKISFGLLGDTPIVGDIDGDGRDDLVVTRDNGRGGLDWYGDTDRDGGLADSVFSHFGFSSDVPLLGDMDGDGKDDLVAVRKEGGGLNWYIGREADWNRNSAAPTEVRRFGLANDIAMILDFDGDGKDDLAAVRANPAWGGYDWYVDITGTSAVTDDVLGFGLIGDYLITGAWA